MSLGIYRHINVSPYVGIAFVVDIDGPNRGDSKLGQDIFQFSYVSPEATKTACKNIGLLLGSWNSSPWGYGGDGCSPTREFFLNACKPNGKSKSINPNGSGCSGLIIQDGWKISSDYPWSYAHKK